MADNKNNDSEVTNIDNAAFDLSKQEHNKDVYDDGRDDVPIVTTSRLSIPSLIIEDPFKKKSGNHSECNFCI